MKYLYWIAAVAVVVLGIYFSFSVSVQPQSQSKIKFIQVAAPEDLGRDVFTQVEAELKTSPVVFLGVTPNYIEDMELWRGFLQKAAESGLRYDMIVIEPMLPYVELFETGLRIDIKAETNRFVEGVKKALDQGMRVAVIVPNIYSSQLLPGNPVLKLVTDHKMNILSLSATKFPVTREQEDAFQPRCIIEEGKDFAGTGPLGCLIQTLARRTYRQKLDAGKYSGLMEQTGPKDYLILLNRN